MKFNFGAGPSALSKEVYEEMAKGIININDSGLSVLEISHRSRDFENILNECKSLFFELMGLNDDYEVLFTHGGATENFLMIPTNFSSFERTAGFVDTGAWSKKIIKQTQEIGNVEVLASSKDKNYSYIPKNYEIPKHLNYLHVTSNNTIFGTQYKEFPKTEVPLIADMSSDILSRKIDATQFSLIYAGFQKNVGPAGGAVVIISKEFLKQQKDKKLIPPFLDYEVYIKNNSMFNTPSVFAIYGTLVNLRWLKRMGGVEKIELVNKEKAQILYDAIDKSPYFEAVAHQDDRSEMNVCFTAKTEAQEKAFLKICQENNIIGIKGHRSVGGFRASIYNAITVESILALCKLIEEFKDN